MNEHSSQTVLPSKAIKNERILETLMFQANSGMYRIQESYIEACHEGIRKQDTQLSEWESFDYTLWSTYYNYMLLGELKVVDSFIYLLYLCRL